MSYISSNRKALRKSYLTYQGYYGILDSRASGVGSKGSPIKSELPLSYCEFLNASMTIQKQS